MTNRPAILVAYPFLKAFMENRGSMKFRSWALDSGAFSVLTRGISIDLNEYIDICRRLMASEPTLTTIFALDVIGDPEASQRNAEAMQKAGIPAIPTFHLGSPWHYLTSLAKGNSRIALGGMAAKGSGGKGAKIGWPDRLAFVEGCFGRVWPKWMHGFGCSDPKIVLKVPFAAVDSTSWFYRVRQYGGIMGYPGLTSPRVSKSREGARAGTRCSLNSFLELEQQVRDRMGRFLAKVSAEPFTLRLATTASTEELSFLGGTR